MNKAGLIDAAAKAAGVSKKDAAAVIGAAIDAVTAELVKGNKVQIVGFGTFEVRTRAERTGRNPATGGTMTFPQSKTAAFKAGKTLKDKVN